MSGTNCDTIGAIRWSVFKRFKIALHGGQVLLPATANMGRPVAAEICFACSKSDAGFCPNKDEFGNKSSISPQISLEYIEFPIQVAFRNKGRLKSPTPLV